MKKSSPLQRWTLYFDGSSTLGAAGAGVVLISPSGQAPQAAKRLKFQTWRYHRLGKTAFVRSLSFSDEGEWQSLVQLRSRSSYLIERVMLKLFFSYLGLTPRKTKDGRARTDILGKALMNYAIPDTYAVRYQPSSPTKLRGHWHRIIPIKNANRHRHLMPSDKGELFRQII